MLNILLLSKKSIHLSIPISLCTRHKNPGVGDHDRARAGQQDRIIDKRLNQQCRA